jgi:integrase
MGEVVQFQQIINVDTLKQNRRLSAGMIAPAQERVDQELAAEHTSEPIKSMDDIMRISEYLIQKERWRDYMLFIVGINFGLRASDLRLLRFSNLINDNLTFKDSFPILEKKTKNTRKHRRNRYITINTAVIEAVTTYLEHTPGISLSDYLFRNEASNAGDENVPLTVRSINRVMDRIADEVGLSCKVSSHTLRKTFCYHQMVMSNNDPRKLMLLSKMLGHSSVAITLDYIGITGEEIEEAYRNLNLGSYTHNYLNSDIGEKDLVEAM